MKTQDECFKTEAHGKWNIYVAARQRSRKNTLTDKYVPFYTSHLCLPLSTSHLPSYTNQAGDWEPQMFGHPSGSNTDKPIFCSPLFPICSYLLLEITPPELQSVCHKHTLFCWESCFTETSPNPPQKKPAS